MGTHSSVKIHDSTLNRSVVRSSDEKMHEYNCAVIGVYQDKKWSLYERIRASLGG